jgi:hypothetical protein
MCSCSELALGLPRVNSQGGVSTATVDIQLDKTAQCLSCLNNCNSPIFAEHESPWTALAVMNTLQLT